MNQTHTRQLLLRKEKVGRKEVSDDNLKELVQDAIQCFADDTQGSTK